MAVVPEKRVVPVADAAGEDPFLLLLLPPLFPSLSGPSSLSGACPPAPACTTSLVKPRESSAASKAGQSTARTSASKRVVPTVTKADLFSRLSSSSPLSRPSPPPPLFCAAALCGAREVPLVVVDDLDGEGGGASVALEGLLLVLVAGAIAVSFLFPLFF